MERLFLGLGAFFASLGVAAGAFGAHALRTRLSHEMLTVFETGVRYQMYHAFGLLIVGVLAARVSSPALAVAGWLFLAGIVVFSGSLYVLSLSGTRWLGAVTPLGGLAFLAGWICLAWAAYSRS